MALLKCLVVDPMHESLFPMLKEIGWVADYTPHITPEEIKNKHLGYDGMIVRSKVTVNQSLLGDYPTIKFVGRAGAGLDNLDLDYLSGKGIHVLHASEGNRDAVGEFTIGALLSLLRNIPNANQEVKQFVWERERNRGEELMGKTIGLIGYGNMGRSVARRLAGFECNVLAYDKYKLKYSDQYVQEASMDDIFAAADILSLHVPLTSETRQMVNSRYISSFKKPFVLINTARGEIVSLADLAIAMDEKQIRGAVLDVLENEKLNTLSESQRGVFNSLKERSNVIFTPHIAGWTFESHVKINVALVTKIKALELSA